MKKASYVHIMMNSLTADYAHVVFVLCKLSNTIIILKKSTIHRISISIKKNINSVIKFEAGDPGVDGSSLVAPSLLLGLLVSEGLPFRHYQVGCSLCRINSRKNILKRIWNNVSLTLAPQVSKLVLAELSVRLGLTSIVSATTRLKGVLLFFFSANLALTSSSIPESLAGLDPPDSTRGV